MTSSPGRTTRTPSTWGRPAAADCPHLRPGFSLIELLLALALLMSVSALVLPQYAGRLNAAEFSESAEQVRSFLHLARAEAQRLGVSVDVTWDPTTRRLTARRHEVEAMADAWQFTGVQGEEPAWDGAASMAQIPEDRPIREHTLAAEVRLRPADEVNTAGGEFSEGATAGALPGERAIDAFSQAEQEPLAICTYLNDGSALYARSLLLDDGGERRVVLRIDEWTGLVSIEDAPEAEADPRESEEPTMNDLHEVESGAGT